MTSEAVDSWPGLLPGRVLVRFIDDEILEGRPQGLDLDTPDFELLLDDHGANAQAALIPLPAVKCVVVERHRVPRGHRAEGMRKVALRFLDGEVLKGLLTREPHRARYGVSVELLRPDAGEIELLSIPYQNLKALFFIKAWDARPSEYVALTGHWEGRRGDVPLTDLLGQIARLTTLRERGEINEDEYRRRRLTIVDRM